MRFILFTSDQEPAAADAYARRLAGLLDAAVVPIASRASVPDVAAYDAARAAWDALEPGTRPLIADAVLPAFAPLAPLLSARRVAIVIHEPFSSAPQLPEADRQLLAAVEQRMLALAPLIVASSEAAADAIAAEAAVPRGRIAVVEPPTPELARAHGSAGHATMIFAPGWRISGHAHDVLLTSLAGLPDLEWRLCITSAAGADPAENSGLAALTERLGIRARVQFAGSADEAAFEAFWQTSDLFACAAPRRGYGLATAAALKRGLPVVICGGERSAPLIPAEAGAIAPPGDRAQLAKALRRLIFDRDLRSVMAEAAWRAGQALPASSAVRAQLLAVLG